MPDYMLEPDYPPAVDCPGFLRLDPCPCGNMQLEDDPPECSECGKQVPKEYYVPCPNTALRGSDEHCGECGYPAPPHPDYEDDFLISEGT